MNLILSLIIGAAAGALALFVVFRGFPTDLWRWIGAIAIGVLGGWVGNLLFGLFGLQQVNWLGSLVVSFVGALIILYIIRRLGPTRE